MDSKSRLEIESSLILLRAPRLQSKDSAGYWLLVIRRLLEAGEIRKAIHDIHDGRDESVYQWALPSYGASNSLANQFADTDCDHARRKG